MEDSVLETETLNSKWKDKDKEGKTKTTRTENIPIKCLKCFVKLSLVLFKKLLRCLVLKANGLRSCTQFIWSPVKTSMEPQPVTLDP